MNKVYLLENLCCANCAAKIEKKVSELPGIEAAVLTFPTKQLRVTAENPDEYFTQIQKIASAIEPDVVIKERVRKSSSQEIAQAQSCDCCGDHDHHDEEESCGCGHEHHEHHEHKTEKAKPQTEGEKDSRFKVSELHTIIGGALLFALGIFTESYGVLSIILFVVSYLILGGSIVIAAVKNIARGQVFDENFLMSIATIGAFAIQQYPRL